MNKAKCLNCGDTIESKSRHDFVTCTCYRFYMHGRNVDTHRERGFDIHGIFLDGGDDYSRYGGNIEDLQWIYD